MTDPKDNKKKALEDVDLFLLEDQGFWEDPREDYDAFEDQAVFEDFACGEGDDF